jgi:hypothetical protein
MIANATEYQKAKEELQSIEARLSQLQQRTHSSSAKGLTKAGIRKVIAHLHEELAVYEGSKGSPARLEVTICSSALSASPVRSPSDRLTPRLFRLN